MPGWLFGFAGGYIISGSDLFVFQEGSVRFGSTTPRVGGVFFCHFQSSSCLRGEHPPLLPLFLAVTKGQKYFTQNGLTVFFVEGYGRRVAAKTCWVDFHRTLLRLPRVEGVKGKLIGGSGMRESGWIMCDCARYHAFSRVSIFNEGVLEGSWIFMESSLRNGRDQTKYVNISTREAVGGRRDPTLQRRRYTRYPYLRFRH